MPVLVWLAKDGVLNRVGIVQGSKKKRQYRFDALFFSHPGKGEPGSLIRVVETNEYYITLCYLGTKVGGKPDQ